MYPWVLVRLFSSFSSCSRAGAGCAGQAWKSCALSVTMQPLGMFSSVYLASVGLAGLVLQWNWALKLGAQCIGDGCGRELNRRGWGLPQAWAGSLGEGHQIHLALEPLFCTQRLASPVSGTAGVLFCPEGAVPSLEPRAQITAPDRTPKCLHW